MKIKLYTVKAVLTVCENFITYGCRFGYYLSQSSKLWKSLPATAPLVLLAATGLRRNDDRLSTSGDEELADHRL